MHGRWRQQRGIKKNGGDGTAVRGSVPKPGAIVPQLVVRDAAEALAFDQAAFGAKVLYRSPSPSGAGERIHVKMWDSLVQLSTEEPRQRCDLVEGALLASPETLFKFFLFGFRRAWVRLSIGVMLGLTRCVIRTNRRAGE